LVVVAEVLGEDCLEMSLGDDEEMVEAVLAHGTDEPLCERVRSG
jgi:hypothetical protein